MFKTGDLYIQFTKHGSVNRGEVKWYGEKFNYDMENGVIYKDPYFVNTNNIAYHLDGRDGRFYKIERSLDKKHREGVEL